MESNTLHRGRLIDHILLVVEDFEASKKLLYRRTVGAGDPGDRQRQ